MNVKIRYSITCVLAAAAIVTATLSVPVLRGFGEASVTETANPSASSLQLSEPVPFILREHNGTVAVFTPESGDAPAMITNINFNSLRDADKKMLRDGIGVRESTALAALLEDFGS